MAQSIERVDHTIPKEEAVFAFGPKMQPVLEIDPGEVVTFETHDCFSGQIQTENDLVTEIDFSKINPATGPVCVRGAEPGDSLIVEILDIRPGPQGVATIISRLRPAHRSGRVPSHQGSACAGRHRPLQRRDKVPGASDGRCGWGCH